MLRGNRLYIRISYSALGYISAGLYYLSEVLCYPQTFYIQDYHWIYYAHTVVPMQYILCPRRRKYAPPCPHCTVKQHILYPHSSANVACTVFIQKEISTKVPIFYSTAACIVSAQQCQCSPLQTPIRGKKSDNLSIKSQIRHLPQLSLFSSPGSH